VDFEALRAERRAQGMTLAALARAIGTSPQTVSAYERGERRASRATVDLLVAAVGAGADSPIYRYGLVTIPAAAAAIRAGLRHSWCTGDLLRIVRELRSNAKHLTSTEDRLLFYAEPSTTGDRRWDALLAGVAELDALRDGKPVPSWARGHELPHLWFVGSQPSTYAHALVHTPSSLAVRGIVLDGASLESV
jgi:transcriptional regulator with XRE-family HTH domain